MKRKILIILSIVGTVLLYTHAHDRALLLRGHSGVGGELLLFIVPVLIWAIYRCFKDTRDVMKDR